MIVSFADKATEDLFHGRNTGRVRKLPEVARRGVTERKLDMLNAATTLEDLAAVPGNALEALRGDREGRHSIRINDQYRPVFRWTGAGPADVEFTDYH